MKEAVAETELFYSQNLNIKPCTGEFICWRKTPGECYIDDEMDELYPKLKEAEILVLATPVYIPFPGKFQMFLNRLVPLMDPILERREGHTRAKLRKDVELQKMVLVSTSGWWEKENFDKVRQVIWEITEDMSMKLSTPILRPHAQLMKRDGNLTEEGKKVLESAKKAGHELIEKGKINQSTADEVSKPLITFDKYLELSS